MGKFPSEKELKKIRKLLDKGISSKILPANANATDRLKFYICEKFVIYKNFHNMNQRSLAEEIGIDEALMSKILHYHFDEFTVDRLIKYLLEIYPKVDLKISVA